jgi:hypothetical protein
MIQAELDLDIQTPKVDENPWKIKEDFTGREPAYPSLASAEPYKFEYFFQI